jgi:transposase
VRYKRLEDREFRWLKFEDGVMRLSAAQFSALLEGLGWRRVHGAKETSATALPRMMRHSGRRKTWSSAVMAQAIWTLPDDANDLNGMLLVERARTERLVQNIKEMQRHRFGRRAETLPEDRMLLTLEEVEETEAGAVAEAHEHEKGTRKRSTDRGTLPARLPRIETVVDIDDKACPCCKGALHRTGEDVSELLDVAPAQFRVLVTRRPKHACCACEEGVVQAPAPARLIEGGLPTEATIAPCVVFKYAIARPRSTSGKGSSSTVRRSPTGSVEPPGICVPVHERLLEHIRSSTKISADETTVPVSLDFCWSHVRRRFNDPAAVGPALIAAQALERFGGYLPDGVKAATIPSLA